MQVLDPLELPLHGVRLIEASAGTGKTYTITTLLLRLIVERRLGIQQILVVTFTRAATAELRERVRRRLKEALDAFDRPSAAEPAPLRFAQPTMSLSGGSWSGQPRRSEKSNCAAA